MWHDCVSITVRWLTFLIFCLLLQISSLKNDAGKDGVSISAVRPKSSVIRTMKFYYFTSQGSLSSFYYLCSFCFSSSRSWDTTSDSILSPWMRNGVGNLIELVLIKGLTMHVIVRVCFEKKWYTKHYLRRLWFPTNTFDPPRWTMSCVFREMLTPRLVFYLDLPYSYLFNRLHKACCTHSCIKATLWSICILK